MYLSGPQFQRISDNLQLALNRDELRRVLKFYMNEDFEKVVKPGDFASEVYDVVDWANRRDRYRDLLKFACVENPSNSHLREIRDTIELLFVPQSLETIKLQVFITSDHTDEALEQHLIRALAKSGIQTKPHTRLGSQLSVMETCLAEAIRESACMVAMLSKQTDKSHLIWREISYAQDITCPVLLVLASGNKSSIVPAQFNQLLCIELQPDLEHAVNRTLVDAIRKQLERVTGGTSQDGISVQSAEPQVEQFAEQGVPQLSPRDILFQVGQQLLAASEDGLDGYVDAVRIFERLTREVQLERKGATEEHFFLAKHLPRVASWLTRGLPANQSGVAAANKTSVSDTLESLIAVHERYFPEAYGVIIHTISAVSSDPETIDELRKHAQRDTRLREILRDGRLAEVISGLQSSDYHWTETPRHIMQEPSHTISRWLHAMDLMYHPFQRDLDELAYPLEWTSITGKSHTVVTSEVMSDLEITSWILGKALRGPSASTGFVIPIQVNAHHRREPLPLLENARHLAVAYARAWTEFLTWNPTAFLQMKREGQHCLMAMLRAGEVHFPSSLDWLPQFGEKVPALRTREALLFAGEWLWIRPPAIADIYLLLHDVDHHADLLSLTTTLLQSHSELTRRRAYVKLFLPQSVADQIQGIQTVDLKWADNDLRSTLHSCIFAASGGNIGAPDRKQPDDISAGSCHSENHSHDVTWPVFGELLALPPYPELKLAVGKQVEDRLISKANGSVSQMFNIASELVQRAAERYTATELDPKISEEDIADVLGQHPLS